MTINKLLQKNKTKQMFLINKDTIRQQSKNGMFLSGLESPLQRPLAYFFYRHSSTSRKKNAFVTPLQRPRPRIFNQFIFSRYL